MWHNTRCNICGAIIGRPVVSRVFKNGWFERFARKERLADDALFEAVTRAERGLIDADLGGGIIKQRVARLGEGRSGGYRTLILFRRGDRAIFAFGFAKSRRGNISQADLAVLRQAAVEALSWSDKDMDRLVTTGALVEIKHEQDDDG